MELVYKACSKKIIGECGEPLEVDISLSLRRVPPEELPTVGQIKAYERWAYCGFIISRYTYRRKERYMIDVYDTATKLVLPVSRASKLQSLAQCERMVRLVLMARRCNYGVSPLVRQADD